MFKSSVAWVLNKYLGKYVQDLDTENLNVGIFNGEVQLHDLKLKPEALVKKKTKKKSSAFLFILFCDFAVRAQAAHRGARRPHRHRVPQHPVEWNPQPTSRTHN